MKIPCKVTLTGDKNYARNFIGAAKSQMKILENQLFFRDLEQGVRSRPLDPRTTVEANICFGLREVKIHSEPKIIEMKKEEGLEKLIPRFFAYIVKVDDITGENTRKYYWIYFVEAGTDMSEYEQTQYLSPIHLNDDYDVYVWGTQNTILETMKNTPRGPDHTHKHPHRHTKSFMMDDRSQEIIDAAIVAGEDLKPERYVSACHMLTKNREIVFMPLHAYAGHGVPGSNEICDILDPLKYPEYPLPYSSTYYLAYASNIFYTGLNFPCPPRRFYCNTEEGIMVWYTTNPTIVEAQNFICGIIYNIRSNVFKTFIHYPSNANGLGFTEYWAIDTTEAELPTPLLFDIQSLDRTGMDVSISWSKRPVNCHTTFSDSSITYSELDTCNHIRWVGGDTGFEAQLFCTFEQHTLDPAPVITSDSMGPLTLDCSAHATYPECIADEMHEMEIEADRESNFYRAYDWGSVHTWDLLGNVLSVIADEEDKAETLYCHEKQERCAWPSSSCINQTYEYNKHKDVEFETVQQITETWSARWVCPNSLDLITNKHKTYCVSTSEIRIDSGIHNSINPPTGDQMDNLLDSWWSPYKNGYLHTVGDYFYQNLLMAGDAWPQIDNDSISGYEITKWKWERSTNVDTSDTDTLHKFQVDEDLEFSYDDVDHIYYLDDRATEDNHGVIAAGKGDSVTELYTDDCLGVIEYKPDYWKIMWKVCWDDENIGKICADIADEDIPYIDITEKLLEALNCEDHELIDLGLI